jgi:hypothetical protein
MPHCLSIKKVFIAKSNTVDIDNLIKIEEIIRNP